ncbi:MAG: spore germination protein [Thermoflavifilum sp.]|nr:spore germination protein [Thermoflavifilum sp.]MCL6515163.1 spore germination protein [Alicyclobacillus sp.]
MPRNGKRQVVNVHRWFLGLLGNRVKQQRVPGAELDPREPHVPDYRRAPHYKGQLQWALDYFANSLGKSDDYMVRILQVAGRSAAILFIDTISDHKIIEETLRAIHQHSFPKRPPKNLVSYLTEKVLTGSDAIYMENMWELRETIAAGNIVLLIDGASPAIVLGAQFVEERKPELPYIETSVRGPQVSFVEKVDTNLGLIRRMLKTETLEVKKLKIGYRSRTEVAVVYIRDVANPVAIDTVIKRLSAIHVDLIDQSSAVEQRIVDNRWTLFPLTRTTQRIDSTVWELNQGKIAIIVDGDPVVLLVPATIQDFFQTAEDHTHSFWEANYIHWLRIIAFILAMFLPGLYVAFVDYNPELLPKVLNIQIAKSREGIPFPALVEVVLMQVVVEILREATIRMPKQMGQTIGIVGGLVVGEASVQAGLVSNLLIIVVALTALSVFVSPSYEFSTVARLCSWLTTFAAALLGFYGIVLFAILFMYHLASLKSFGVSYLDPFNGEHVRDLFVDGLVRVPAYMIPRRTAHLHPQDEWGEARYVNPVPHPQLEKARFYKRHTQTKRRP